MIEQSQQDAIMSALRQVVEPCSLAFEKPTNIVDMGLVEKVENTADGLRVTLCLTDAACIHFTGMKQYIADVLEPLGYLRVEVVQTLDQLWTPDRVLSAG